MKREAKKKCYRLGSLLCMGTTITIIKNSFDTTKSATKQQLIIYHVLGMTLGLFLIPTISMIAVRLRHLQSSMAGKEKAVKAHLVLNNVSLMLAGAAGYAIYESKNSMNKGHLTSWHSWFGVATFSFAVLSGMQGGYNLNIMGKRLKFVWRSSYHRTLGKSAYLTALVAIGLGLRSQWGMKHLGEQLVNILTVTTAGTLILMVVPSFMKDEHHKSSDDDKDE